MERKEKPFVEKTQSGLRRGYTTGSCAAAASLAASVLLFSGERLEHVSFLTPKDVRLHIAVERWEKGSGWARCAVRKYAGDDPDITDGVLVYSRVSLKPGEPEEENQMPKIPSDSPDALKACGGRWYEEKVNQHLTLYLRGGEGIGKVTREGLSCPVGMWAINPVPRSMVFEQVSSVCEKAKISGSVWITLEIPEGKRLAEKTFNPRLGIAGGLSVLGSSGIVEPMSEPALLETIRLEIRQKALEGEACLLLTPGNYGEKFLAGGLFLPVEKAVKCSNYIGKALDMASDAGVKKLLLVGHAGKLIKLAAGIMNTHSQVADGRMECLAAYGAACGASNDIVKNILDCITVDEALGYLEQEEGLRERTMNLAVSRVFSALKRRTGEGLQAEAVLFTNERGILGMTEGAQALIELCRE